MTIFDEAKAVVYNGREKEYGPPEDNFTNIAEFWNLWLKARHNVVVALLPDDVAVMMSLLKHARLIHTIDHRDSQKDAIGYIGTLERIQPNSTVTAVPFPQRIGEPE